MRSKSKNPTAVSPMAANSNKTKSKKSSRQMESPPSSSNPTKPFDWLNALYEDQVGASAFLIENLLAHRGVGLLSDPGTGKTVVSMAVIQYFMPKRLLIVAPLTSLEVTWAKRLRTIYGTIVNSVSEYTGEGVLLIGYEHFRTAKNIKKIIKMDFDFALFDESQGLKHRGSNQSRAVRRLRMRVPQRMILSGTPIDESPIDMWGQMRFIAPEVLGDVWSPPRDHRKYKGPYFEEEFCRKCGFMGYQREFIPEKLPEFLDRISPHLYRLTNDMEEAEIIPVYCDLDEEQRVVYDQMEEHGIVKVDGKKSKAGLKPVRDLRCFQITGGSLKMDDGSTLIVGHSKQKALAQLLARVDRPVVFCRFLPELDDAMDVLRRDFDNVRYLDGSVKDKKQNKRRTQLIEDFQARKIGALAVQARTGGVSIEFTATHELVFYSMGYSYIDFKQIIARFRRYGQEKRVKVFLIIARDTIDEEPMKRIVSKGETVEPIMKHLKEKSMADAKKAAKKAVKKVAKKAKVESTKKAIGIEYVADKLDVSPGAARMKCRDHNIAKDGKSYGWDTKADADKVVAKIEKATTKKAA